MHKKSLADAIDMIATGRRNIPPLHNFPQQDFEYLLGLYRTALHAEAYLALQWAQEKD